jgi:hypothetical protein
MNPLRRANLLLQLAIPCLLLAVPASAQQVLAWGNNTYGQCNVPALPAGLTYVEVACGFSHSVARRSDGTVVAFGRNLDGQCNVPALAAGVYYLQIAAGYYHSAARRSDGSMAEWGSNGYGQLNAPTPPAGLKVDEVGSGYFYALARVALPSTCGPLGYGCAGSLPVTRLVPQDTPRIGRRGHVRLFDLPDNLAVMVIGWSRFSPTPVDLGFVGMPGCPLWISPDAQMGVVGAGHQALWQLPMPDQVELVGLHLYQQALVLDAAAGNGFGAVVSEAAEMVVGR